jgi:hypothetical protein
LVSATPPPAIVTPPHGIQPLAIRPLVIRLLVIRLLVIRLLVIRLLVTRLLATRLLVNQLQPILSNCLTGELQQTTAAAAERHYSC